MNLFVSLTADHIRIGGRNSRRNHPICHALRAIGCREVEMVGTGFVEACPPNESRLALYGLPSDLVLWDLAYERGDVVGPVDFEVKEVVNG
ncbi:hypothetical protein EON79_07545 [bacterium]|nr:MAG: hypothetical protein EON79_07545 [bacterium]